MLVVLDTGTGQMCNQMLMQMNVLASAYDRHYKVRFYNFKKYEGVSYSCPEIEQVFSFMGGGTPRIRLLAVKIVNKFLRSIKLKSKRIVMASDIHAVQAVLEEDISKKDIYCYGWPFYDLPSLRKNASLIRQYFAPNENSKRYVDGVFENICSLNNEKIVVGVHMRRGDYRIWRNGEFYFEDEVYKHYMDQLCDILITEGKQVVYILFSNEPVNREHFYSENYSVVVAEGSAIEDFFTQAKCDYLIGPPSSFSGVASFLGEVPRYIVVNKNDKLSLDKMKIWLMETDGWINAI